MTISGKLLRIDDVTADQREQMYQLMCRYFANVTRNVFDADFAEKDWVIVALREQDQAICGFSTQMLINFEVNRERVKFLYSGDTIVDPQYWGQNPLAGIWGRMALALIDQSLDVKLYWFLIAMGYKTYRFLPVFFREFYPRFDLPTQPTSDRMIRAIARARYRERFDEQAGIIRATGDTNRLREEVAPVSNERLTDLHVAYFCRKNPGHIQGDELCCLAPLTRDNFKPAAYRVMDRCKPVSL